MADDVLVEKVFNFICGSGGFVELSFLLKDSSPLKSLTTELEAKNWLKTQARGRFVAVKDYNDEIAGVRIDLRKKVCQQYLDRGLCSRAQGKCKFWHICKSFIEGNCDGKCGRSHNFFDPNNIEKTKELGIEKHSNGTVRNIVAWSLPQVCQLYLRNECKLETCPYLHLCSEVVRGSSCCCVLSHNLTDSHNKIILKQYDLVPHQSMKVVFVRSNILVTKEQRCFEPALAKKPSLPRDGNKDAPPSSTTVQGTSSNTARSSKESKSECKSQLQTEERNQKKQQITKDREPVVNNLANISTASPPCKNSLEFRNIQAEENENCSDSSSEENKTASDSFKTFKYTKEDDTHAQPADKSQLENQMTAQSPRNSFSAVQSGCKERENISKGIQTKNVPQKKSLVDSCGAKDDDSAATKVQSTKKPRSDGKKTPASTVPSGLPVDDIVKKWVLGSEEKHSSDLKETPSLSASQDEAVHEERQRKVSFSSSCSSLPDLQECTPSKKVIFDCILKEYNGVASFAVISSRQDLFPNGCGDITAWFKARKYIFLLSESKEGRILEVSAFCRWAQLCFNQACQRKNCQFLHVCRDYIAGFCRFGNGCQRNHSFQFDEDRKFLSKLRLNGLTEENLRKVIQLSIPQVCLDYNEGYCARGQSCTQIHICKDMIRKKCEDEEYCGLQHQSALLTAQATAILQNYGLPRIKDGNVNPVLRVLLVCENKPGGSKDYRKCTVSAATDSMSVGATASKVSNQGVPVPPKAADVSYEPSERKVFECLCKEYNCSVAFSVIAKRTDLFSKEFKEIEAWFRKKTGSFLIREDESGRILQVDAFSAKARLCFSYNNAYYGTCKKDNCSYLHVCRDYVTDSCSDGATCPRNHHFHNPRDNALLSRINLNQLTDQQLRKLVLSSTPHVCVEYNDGICDRGDYCSRIHMCSDHLKKCYGERSTCDLDHESAMTTEHTRTVLERYHLGHLKSDVAKRIILVYDDSPTKSKETGHVHQDKPDTPICSDFLLGKCKKGAKCSGHHCSLPFHWQYKVPDVGKWKSFSENDNEKLEKLYCDETLEECTATGFQISFESEGFLLLDREGYDVNFLLDNKLMIVQKDFEVIAQIRRLSTESHVTNPGNTVATAWTWYWKDENGTWRQYDVDQLGRDLQRSFEETFLNKTNCFKFRISDQDYALYFSPPTEMYQDNLKYGTTKKVRRRPAEVKSAADILELKRSRKPGKNATSAKVPSHWSAMPSDKQYKRIPITAMSSEYKEVATLFKQTINKSVTINSIERVQNPFMWEKYQRKKDHMMAVKTGGQKRFSVNERRLFHGTSPETVEAICKQNFDWRLHGKNATVYGEGSYFALNASYSDAYAKEDGNSSQFMFLAKVLVGSYTRGRSSYRRPPQKDPSNPASDLYDSCVDDTSNPTIFVAFDTDQFYPEYIIKYSQARSQAAYGGYQQPVVRMPVPMPRQSQAAASYSGASQVHTSSAAASRPSVYSSGSSSSGGLRVPSYNTPSGVHSGGYSSASNTHSTPYQSTTRGSYAATPSGYSTSASNTSNTPYQSTTSSSYYGTSSGYSSSATSSTPHRSTTSGSYSPYGASTQSTGSQYRSSTKDKSKCLVM